jgi:hypothetical protein
LAIAELYLTVASDLGEFQPQPSDLANGCLAIESGAGFFSSIIHTRCTK